MFDELFELYKSYCAIFSLEPKEAKNEEEVLELLKEFKDYVERWYIDVQANNKAMNELIEAQLEELTSTYESLSTLFEVNNILSSVIEPWKTLKSVLKTMQNAVRFETAFVSVNLLGNNVEEVLGNPDVATVLKIKLDEEILVEKDPKLGSYIVVPFISQDRNYGFLFVNSFSRIFSAGDKKIVSSIAQQIVNSFDKYVALQDEIEKRKVEEQLTLARNIQMGLFPKNFPTKNVYEIYGESIPAREVGGDYFDVIETSDGAILACVADVSGKGLPAALIMSSIRSALRTASRFSTDLVSIAVMLDKMISQDFEVGKFVTAILMKLWSDGSIELVNAGHDPLYIFDRTGIQTIEASGTPLGILDAGLYEERKIKLNPNSILVAFTDGIVEARNIKKEEYGFGRMEKNIQNKKYLSAINIVDELLRDIFEFSQGAPQHDDMTLLVVKY